MRLLDQWLVGVVILLVLALLVVIKRAFGGEYAEYETRVRRLLPFVY